MLSGHQPHILTEMHAQNWNLVTCHDTNADDHSAGHVKYSNLDYCSLSTRTPISPDICLTVDYTWTTSYCIACDLD